MNKRKIYYSFDEIPFNTKPYNVGYSASGIKFSKTEIIHILISMIVLTIAFSFALSPTPPLGNLSIVLGNIPIAFLAIVSAFFCHEIAHKYVGQKYGYWSEFRMFPQGLLFALFLGVFVGIVFAAPGAVQIFGRPSREESGKISIAGPLTNLIIGIFFTLIYLISTGYLNYISLFLAYINVFLALFNLLPFGPLDGMKLYRWKPAVWLIMISGSIVLFIMLIMYR
jgi:Zn-dependent protease